MSSAEPEALSIPVFFQTVHGFHQTAALKAGIELDVFTVIGDGVQTAQAIAERCRCSTRGARILCDYLVTIGWLRKSADRYALTPTAAAFASRRSPQYLGGTLEFLLAEQQTRAFQNLTEVVRRGGAATEAGPQGGVVAPENPLWVKFARAMMPLMQFPAQLLAEQLVPQEQSRPLKVLDVAAGHGLYGLAIARRSRDAQITALDWGSVLTVARENAEAAGMAGRYHTIEGSAFEQPFGEGYDLVLLVNFLHHFDLETCAELMRKAHAALAPGGRAAILEFIPDDSRVTPEVPAQFALMMLACTPGGDAYPFSLYEELVRKAGFRTCELRALAPTFFRTVIASK